MTEPLHVSIDLEAELRKIAQRQHLNDVHHLVQLARHAMRHTPRAIEVESTAHRLVISQDGDPFSLKERDLLLAVLDGNDLLRQQEALRELERETGATLLALMLRFPGVEVSSDGWGLLTEPGSPPTLLPGSPRRGYRIGVRRRAPRRGREEEELRFFCSGAAVPIRYNGRVINRPLDVNGILRIRRQDESGAGALGIPSKGRLSALSYCKQGIRFGFRRFLDPQGRVVEGFWDSHLAEFEPTFSASIRAGEEFLASAGAGLYEAAGAQFAGMIPPHRERLRELMLASPPLERWVDVSLFDTVERPFALSLRDLRKLEARHGAIPCALRRWRSLPGWLPLLSLSQIHALRADGHVVMVVPSRTPRLRRWTVPDP